MGMHVFIDETKAKSYVVVAAMCPYESLHTASRVVRDLAMPGQRSIHMKQEGRRRRGEIANAVCGLRQIGVRAILLDAGKGPEPEHVRRDRALRVVVERVAHEPATRLVIDLDQTLRTKDSRTIAEAIREHSATSVSYEHQSLWTEPLLAIPDVIAWCWARDGDWRRRIGPMLSDIVRV